MLLGPADGEAVVDDRAERELVHQPAEDALTSLVGNGVATLTVARWDRQLDVARAQAVLRGNLPFVPARAAAPPVAAAPV